MDFKVKVDAARAEAALGRLAAKIDNLSPVMAEISQFLLVVTEHAFDDERDPTTLTPWQRLATSTIRKRQEKGTWPGKKLHDSGDMQRAVLPFSDATTAQVGIAALRQASDGFFYPVAQQFGTNRVPARPFFGLSPADEGSILQIVGSYLIP